MNNVATVAEQLKAARMAQRLSLQRVAEVTRMRVEHVRAIEDGDYDSFVAPVYLRGFVRAYARFVRLDEQAVLQQLDRELGRREEPLESAPSPPVPENAPRRAGGVWPRNFRWRAAAPIVGGIVIALAGYFALRPKGASAASSASGFPPGLYPGARLAASDVLPLPPLPRPAD